MSTDSEDSWFSGMVATGKDFIAMLRDGMLLLLAVLLLGWPQTINNILVEAGFEEGSFAGVKWKAKLTESDETLLKAQSTIADLREQNEKLNSALLELKSQVANDELKQNIVRLDQINTRLSRSSATVQAAVETTTSANARLVQKAQLSLGTVVTWGVVFGGDETLPAAQHEVTQIARTHGVTGSAIYYRNSAYRSVVTTTDRLQANQLLTRAKQYRSDSYLVNMSTWCQTPISKEGYIECTNG